MKAASTPFKKKKKQSGVWLTLLPLYLFTLVFVAGPLVYMFVLSFQTRAEVWGVVNQFTLDNYKNIFQPVYLNTFVESFKLALTSTLLICAIGYPFGYFHHEPAHQNSRLLLRAVHYYLLLYRQQIYHVHLKAAAVRSQNSRQLFYLLLSSRAGVRIRMEVNRLNEHTSLGHHPCGHRAVYASREKHHALAVGAKRQASEAVYLSLVYIRPVVPHVHVEEHVRVVYIYF